MNSHEEFVINKFKVVGKLVEPNSKVLDIGCNEGKLRDYLKNCDYYCIDIDEKIVDKIKKESIKAESADLNKDELPFKHEKFDYIFLLDVLEHVINPSELLQKTKNKLNKNGKIVITLPNDYHLLNKLRFIFNKHLTEDPFAPYGHLHYFPIKSGKEFIIKNKFKILKKINLAPVKPRIIPQTIKNVLTKLFPQSFARDVLYLLVPN